MIYFITAIGTDCGKTLVSAIFTEALGSTYWKPIQCGLPRDLVTVKSLVKNPDCSFESETYLFSTPASPHAAAKKENKTIDLSKIELPPFKKDLVIEGAGGVLVPLNTQEFVIDIAEKFDAEVILVANIYLGSINHSLLSLRELKRRNIKLKGIIFNGKSNPDTTSIILKHAKCPNLLDIDWEEKVSPEMIAKYAQTLKKNLHG